MTKDRITSSASLTRCNNGEITSDVYVEYFRLCFPRFTVYFTVVRCREIQDTYRVPRNSTDSNIIYEGIKDVGPYQARNILLTCYLLPCKSGSTLFFMSIDHLRSELFTVSIGLKLLFYLFVFVRRFIE